MCRGAERGGSGKAMPDPQLGPALPPAPCPNPLPVPVASLSDCKCFPRSLLQGNGLRGWAAICGPGCNLNPTPGGPKLVRASPTGRGKTDCPIIPTRGIGAAFGVLVVCVRQPKHCPVGGAMLSTLRGTGTSQNTAPDMQTPQLWRDCTGQHPAWSHFQASAVRVPKKGTALGSKGPLWVDGMNGQGRTSTSAP